MSEVRGYNPFNPNDDHKAYRENYRQIDWNSEGPRFERRQEQEEKGKSFNVRVFNPFFHVGIGEYIRNSKELKEAYRRHGVVEVGTEDTRKNFKGMSKEQIREMSRGR